MSFLAEEERAAVAYVRDHHLADILEQRKALRARNLEPCRIEVPFSPIWEKFDTLCGLPLVRCRVSTPTVIGR